MTKYQENTISMYFTVQQVTNFHSEAWKDFTAFKNIFQAFEKQITKIDKTRQIQLRSIIGVTQNKKDLMFKAVEKGFLIAQSIYSYSKIINDNKTAARVSFTVSKLMNKRDTVVFIKLRDVIEIAQNFTDQLADYGVTQDDIDELNMLTEQYAAQVEDPRQAVTNRARATKELKDLLNEANMMLRDHLDRLIYHFKASAPEFWQQYKNARKIVNLGRRKRKDAEENIVTKDLQITLAQHN
jgi:hypothetical protein